MDSGQALQWVLLMDPLWLPKSGRYLFIAILNDKPDYQGILASEIWNRSLTASLNFCRHPMYRSVVCTDA